ncbi:translin-associated factor X-interacting protein 1 isoform X3 [Acanthochromis polyacanthus]|uniref:translin-associated factor X-interacting protein 1 isoform X3 n=1 Tax=Acanthochromis polyacanthus TaxID=80966 RepID=UPI0022344D51|nr:translin-associated factor X-interacting protein 1 isoform X3 [Acanthochromis polyacanthus]
MVNLLKVLYKKVAWLIFYFRLTYDHNLQNDTVQTSEEGHEGQSSISVQTSATRKLCWTGSSYIYGGPDRKPQLLTQLEAFLNKELHNISPSEPKFPELKLQVYRNVFGCFIKAFKTYQPLLSAIKKEYDNMLVLQQDQIRDLEPLRSHLRLLTEECDRKIQARWGEEQAEIRALKSEKQQLQKDIEAMREKEKATQTVDHLQAELSHQYLQYREERDARKLLIWQLNDLTRVSEKKENPADEDSEQKDRVELKLALKMCREDLTKTQEELSRMKADYWDVVPRRNWDKLEEEHKDSLLQMKTLQRDFDQLKTEFDILLELHNRSNTRTHVSTAVQTDASVFQGQSQIESSQPVEPITSNAPESGTQTVGESRDGLGTARSDEGTDEHVASTGSRQQQQQ